MVAALLVWRLAFAAIAIPDPARLVESWLSKSALVNRLADALGGRCWNVGTFSVQVLGRTMCLQDKTTQRIIQNGRTARIAALKAVGLSVTMGAKEERDQEKHNQAVDRIRSYTVLLQRVTRTSIPLVAPAIRAFTRPVARERTAYQLSVAGATLMATPRTAAPVFARDPIGMALLARSAAVTQALDRVTFEVAGQLKARDASIASGHAVGAGAARQDAEQVAMATYLAAVRTAARSQHAQLAAYMTLEREKAHLIEEFRNAKLSNRSNW